MTDFHQTIQDQRHQGRRYDRTPKVTVHTPHCERRGSGTHTLPSTPRGVLHRQSNSRNLLYAVISYYLSPARHAFASIPCLQTGRNKTLDKDQSQPRPALVNFQRQRNPSMTLDKQATALILDLNKTFGRLKLSARTGIDNKSAKLQQGWIPLKETTCNGILYGPRNRSMRSTNPRPRQR
jgi:hypothetical protein